MIMSVLKVFENMDFGASIRVVIVDDNPWFVAKDVSLSLGYVNHRDAIIKHCKKYKPLKDLGVAFCDSLDQQTNMVCESDIYRLIMRSHLPNAERFQDWVVEEVFPSIRKTGSYSIEQKTPAEMLLMYAQQMVEIEKQQMALAKKQQEQDERIEAIEAKQEALDRGCRDFSVMAWANLRGIQMPIDLARKFGKFCADKCRSLNLPIGNVRDPRFGKVNTYLEDVLDEAAQEFEWGL
jgi:prophage antirepressor-like protein